MEGLGERWRLLEVTKVLRRSGHHGPKPLLEDSGRIHVYAAIPKSSPMNLRPRPVGLVVIESTVA